MINSRLHRLCLRSAKQKEHIAFALPGLRDDERCDERRINIIAGEER